MVQRYIQVQSSVKSISIQGPLRLKMAVPCFDRRLPRRGRPAPCQQYTPRLQLRPTQSRMLDRINPESRPHKTTRATKMDRTPVFSDRRIRCNYRHERQCSTYTWRDILRSQSPAFPPWRTHVSYVNGHTDIQRY
jgi:hypothetical protein